jgi:pilus assembly protein CpaB
VHPPPLIDSLRRAFRWHRRWFAGLFAAVAVLAALNTLSAPESSGAIGVVATHSIPGGARLTAADLQLVRLPAALAAAGSFTDTAALIGRTVVARIPQKRVLTESDLLESAGLVAAGKVAMPVRFGESSALPLLRVGGRIDVLGPVADGSGYGSVAGDVRVVAVPEVGDSGMLGGNTDDLVLVEVDQAQAAAIAAAAAVSTLSFAMR